MAERERCSGRGLLDDRGDGFGRNAGQKNSPVNRDHHQLKFSSHLYLLISSAVRTAFGSLRAN